MRRFRQSRLVVPNRPYYLTIAEESPDLRRGHYSIYGKRPLRGQARPGNFYFAYQKIGPQSSHASEDTFEFVRSYLQHPETPAFKPPRTSPAPEIALSNSRWAVDNQVPGEVAATPYTAFKTSSGRVAAFSLDGTRPKRSCCRSCLPLLESPRAKAFP